MNLSGIVSNVTKAVRGAAKGAGIAVKAHAPEILISGGLFGFGVTIYEACRSTSRAKDILDEKDEQINEVLDGVADGEHSEAVAENTIHAIEKRAKWAVIKAYLPTATTGFASVILILSGYKVLNGRYVGAAMLCKTLEAGFEQYRGNVIEEFGEEVDWRMMNSVKPEDMEKALREREENRAIREENKGKLIGRKKPLNRYSHLYENIFDCASVRWRRYWTPQQALEYARVKCGELNDKLMIEGVVFENDYNDKFGFPKTAQGQLRGWVRQKGQCAGHIKIGIEKDEMPESVLRDILSTNRNADIRIPLRPNFDGIVYQELGKNGEIDPCIE